MFVNKYKPFDFNNIILDKTLKEKFVRFVEKNNIPNLILSGAPGVGKSALVNCIIHEYYGNDFSEYVNFVNIFIGIDKNINQFNDNLLIFCKKQLLSKNKNKMIIIDNSDNIPEKIQNILSSVMEIYTNCIYIFVCNNTIDLCETIQSRCVHICVRKQDDTKIYDHLIRICKKEKIKYDDDAIKFICFISQGDIRMAMNNLQAVHIGCGNISECNILKLCDVPSYVILDDIIKKCIDGKIKYILKKTFFMTNEGYSCDDILCGLFELLKNTTYAIDDNIRHKFIEIISCSRYDVSKNIDSLTQLNACMLKLCRVNN